MAEAGVPLQNRVTPEGEIVATPHRGLLLGNRGGAFHRPDRTLGRRRWATRQWIACVLSFKDRHREVMQPNRYTELFFLDEATALAAGHRPCYECRRADAVHFAALWAKAHDMADSPSAPQMDEILHQQRVDDLGAKVTWTSSAQCLPDGTMIRLLEDDQTTSAHLVDGQRLLAWSLAGYGAIRQRPMQGHLAVLTPRSIVAVLSAGYRPMLHPSAAEALRS
jgi:hypothetical protein